MNNSYEILTGMRPSGRLHLGHYVGALENWVRLQNEGHKCNFLIADYHALGDNFDDVNKIRNSVLDVTLDWISVGLDPLKSNFIVQSYVPEHTELFMMLMPLITVSRLERNPTLKLEIKQLEESNKTLSLSFYTYPASQVADILLYNANAVPVGEDQEPHIELTREIARKFNSKYGYLFAEPRTLLTKIPRLVGIDGKAKMSKSLNNSIFLSDSKEEIGNKVRSMYTDPSRIRATDPGHIEGNVVFMYLGVFHKNKGELAGLEERYKSGRISDRETKEILVDDLDKLISPFREIRSQYENDVDKLRSIIEEGSERGREIAKQTIRKAKLLMGIYRY